MKPAYHRGVIIPLANGATIYDDTYNSNPYALARTLELMTQADVRGRRIAVIGDMLELGEQELQFHRDAGEGDPEVDRRGHGRASATRRVRRRCSTARAKPGSPTTRCITSTNAQAAGEFLKTFIREGDLVLIKGSRGVGLDKAVAILERAAMTGGAHVMLYHLLYQLRDVFVGFNVFRYITFRTAFAALTALLISFILGPWLIERMRHIKLGQYIREEGPKSHQVKAGTPTMGGMLINVAILIPTILWADITNPVHLDHPLRHRGVRRDRLRRRLSQAGQEAEPRPDGEGEIRRAVRRGAAGGAGHRLPADAEEQLLDGDHLPVPQGRGPEPRAALHPVRDGRARRLRRTRST